MCTCICITEESISLAHMCMCSAMTPGTRKPMWEFILECKRFALSPHTVTVILGGGVAAERESKSNALLGYTYTGAYIRICICI